MKPRNLLDSDLRERELTRYRDPPYIYQFLQCAMLRQREECGDEFPVIPLIGLVDVIHVDLREKYRERELEIWVRAVRVDGRLDVLEYAENSSFPDYSGGDAGHFESCVRWRNLDDDGTPIRWSHLYTADPATYAPPSLRANKSVQIVTVNEERKSKMTALYHALKNTVRVRIVNHELQFNERQRPQVYQRLGHVLLGFSEKDPIWNSPDMKK